MRANNILLVGAVLLSSLPRAVFADPALVSYDKFQDVTTVSTGDHTLTLTKGDGELHLNCIATVNGKLGPDAKADTVVLKFVDHAHDWVFSQAHDSMKLILLLEDGRMELTPTQYDRQTSGGDKPKQESFEVKMTPEQLTQLAGSSSVEGQVLTREFAFDPKQVATIRSVAKQVGAYAGTAEGATTAPAAPEAAPVGHWIARDNAPQWVKQYVTDLPEKKTTWLAAQKTQIDTWKAQRDATAKKKIASVPSQNGGSMADPKAQAAQAKAIEDLNQKIEQKWKDIHAAEADPFWLPPNTLDRHVGRTGFAPNGKKFSEWIQKSTEVEAKP